MKLDVRNTDELEQYLLDRGLIEKSPLNCRSLPGGVSAETVFVEANHPLVIKQALNKLKTSVDWFSDPARIGIEYKGLKWLHNHLPGGSVPEPVLLDEDNSLLIMEGIADPVKNLKSMLLAREFRSDLIQSFGTLLGTIHQQGLADSEAPDIFADQNFFINLRIEPYYRHCQQQKPELSEFFDKLVKATLDQRITMVHGDYSPKNILVKDDRLILLDHEVIHYGDPAFDVGFSLTHLLSKANHLEYSDLVDMAQLYWDSYRKVFSFNEDGYERRCTQHLFGCMMARIFGKSPLEYLTREQQGWQSDVVMNLIDRSPNQMAEVFEYYKQALNGKN